MNTHLSHSKKKTLTRQALFRESRSLVVGDGKNLQLCMYLYVHILYTYLKCIISFCSTFLTDIHIIIYKPCSSFFFFFLVGSKDSYFKDIRYHRDLSTSLNAMLFFIICFLHLQNIVKEKVGHK